MSDGRADHPIGGSSPLRGPWGYPLLVGVALLSYGYSLPWRVGLAPAGMVDHSTCVLYVANIVLFSGAGAGALMISALADVLNTPASRSVTRIAELSAIGCLVATLFFIMIDGAWLGHWRHLAQNGQLTLPPVQDLMIIVLYLGNAVALAYFASAVTLIRSLRKTSSWEILHSVLVLAPNIFAGAWWRLRKDLLAILAAAAMLLYSTTAWIVGLLDTQSGWQTISIAALQYCSSLVVGLAMVVMAGSFSSALLLSPIERNLLRRLGDILAVLLPLLGYCLWAEMRAVMLEQEPLGSHLAQEMVLGPYAPLFWFALVGGVLVPFVLLIFHRTATPVEIGFAALLVVSGGLVERWNVVILPLLGHAHAFYTAAGYVPTSLEVPMTLAVYAITILVYGVAAALDRRTL